MRALRSYCPKGGAIVNAWLPIESAPKDGTEVFAWRVGWRPAWVRWILNPRTNTEFWNDADELDVYELENEPPTHWLPIELPDGHSQV